MIDYYFRGEGPGLAWSDWNQMLCPLLCNTHHLGSLHFSHFSLLVIMTWSGKVKLIPWIVQMRLYTHQTSQDNHTIMFLK